ncbi:MAG: LON peptidase substrate-binding domain-containing protein [Pseudomonadota bacterium]
MVETGLSGAIPTRFPVFPLSGAILLPGGNLPLNIFEPRYLQMTRDAMQGDRLIGMVQPSDEASEDLPEIYQIGCLGRIASFNETEDGRYLIALTGLCRYDVLEELTVVTPYRQIVASFDRWQGDLQQDIVPEDLRPPLCTALRSYFEVKEISADWSQIETAPMPGLITSLAMICPFEPCEKQALLEAVDAEARARALIALLQMGALGDRGESVRH